MEPVQSIGNVKSRVRAARYATQKTLIVSSKTLGTNLVFDLTTENISRSGMLLSWENGTPIPFIESTILEMTIDPKGHYLSKPVICLGKVVRKFQEKKHGGNYPDVTFGISIVQIDDQDLLSWETCIADLASRSSPVLTEDPAVTMKPARALKQA